MAVAENVTYLVASFGLTERLTSRSAMTLASYLCLVVRVAIADHHWIPSWDEDWDEPVMACKHCPAQREMLDSDHDEQKT